MLEGKKITVVMPAYNAAATLWQTYEALPKQIVDDVILVDDASRDGTVPLARELGILVVVHADNLGYGGNQKTCYRVALERGADVVVMLHPDYQYSPRLVPAMASMVVSGEYDLVLGSRILGKGALVGGMPLYKYLANRVLTFIENILVGHRLSEYHTGFRAWDARALSKLPLASYSNDFVFDNQILIGAIGAGLRVGEISCPTRYTPESSSISFTRSVTYGIGVLGVALRYRWKKTFG